MNEINLAAFDRFTLAHFVVGLAAAQLLTFPQIAAAAILFEIHEDPLKIKWPWLFPHPTLDTKVNALVDVGAFILGGWVGGDL